ncbi:MAG TPA: aminotransferase class IV [Hyphomicrobiaceae bacterium]|nr:aminotransferase class IV [Hyphomicrobiaceae bacterium]
MTERANQRIAYFNGRYVPEIEVRVPYRDRSFLYGDGCFDMTRTFNGKPFKVKEHIERFYRSLAYLRIDIGMSAADMTEVTHEVLRRNQHLLQEGDDFWLGQRVSRGVAAVGDEGWENTGPNVIVDCRPLPFKQRAKHYRDGIKVIVPSVRRTPPYALSPRTKTHNYLNMVMADMEVHAQDPEAWAVLLDENGNLCEGLGSNVFVVKNGRLMTPRERYVLAGVSRATVIELARELKIDVEERDLDLYDAYTADEMFLTSTSLCLCGVSSVNGAPIGGGKIPGPITRQLLDAYSDLVSCDIAGQYLRRLE